MSSSTDLQTLTAVYRDACRKHNVVPVEKVLQQLERSALSATPINSLDLAGIAFGENTKEVRAMADLFKCDKFAQIFMDEVGLGDDGTMRICQSLNTSTLLVRIDLGYNDIRSKGMKSIAEMIRKLPSLRCLDLKGNPLDSSAARVLGAALASKECGIQVLRLQEMNMDNKSLTILCDSLKHCLSLMNLHLGENGINPQGAKAVGQLLSSNQTLTNLDLRNNSLTDQGVSIIAQSLAHNTGLLGLVLWKNDIHARGVQALMASLQGNSRVQSLDLGVNPLGADGMNWLKEMLLVNRSLTNLGVAATEMVSEGAVCLAEALGMNTSLQSLDLRRNAVGVAGIMAMERSLRLNHTLCTIAFDAISGDFADNDMEVELRAKIKSICDDNRAAAEDRKQQAASSSVGVANEVSESGTENVTPAVAATAVAVQETSVAAEAEEQARLAAEAEEQARLAAEAEEQARLAAEAEEQARIAAEAEEQARLAAEAEEQALLAAEAEEQARIAAEAEEQARIAAEAEEQSRLAAEAEEQARIAAEAEEQARIAAEAEEQARLAAEAEEQARVAAEAEEQARIAAEAEEQARLAAEAEEQARIAAEAEEQARIAAEAEEQARIAAKVAPLSQEEQEKNAAALMIQRNWKGHHARVKYANREVATYMVGGDGKAVRNEQLQEETVAAFQERGSRSNSVVSNDEDTAPNSMGQASEDANTEGLDPEEQRRRKNAAKKARKKAAQKAKREAENANADSAVINELL